MLWTLIWNFVKLPVYPCQVFFAARPHHRINPLIRKSLAINLFCCFDMRMCCFFGKPKVGFPQLVCFVFFFFPLKLSQISLGPRVNSGSLCLSTDFQQDYFRAEASEKVCWGHLSVVCSCLVYGCLGDRCIFRPIKVHLRFSSRTSFLSPDMSPVPVSDHCHCTITFPSPRFMF